MARGDRYLMVEVSGYAEKGGRGATSFSILDSCHNYVEVYVSYVGTGGAEERRRRIVEERLHALNRDERGWERRK